MKLKKEKALQEKKLEVVSEFEEAEKQEDIMKSHET
jgi:hypothetical protein